MSFLLFCCAPSTDSILHYVRAFSIVTLIVWPVSKKKFMFCIDRLETLSSCCSLELREKMAYFRLGHTNAFRLANEHFFFQFTEFTEKSEHVPHDFWRKSHKIASYLGVRLQKKFSNYFQKTFQGTPPVVAILAITQSYRL